MLSESDRALLAKLYTSGVQLTVDLPDPAGVRGYVLQEDQAELALTDKIQLQANLYGVDKSDVITWITSEFNVLCAGTTATNRPCRCVVRDGHKVGLRQFIEMQGQLCPAHEDKTPTRS